MTNLPPPTDDELLLAFVDNCPNMAMADYVRRNCMDRHAFVFLRIFDHFEREWKRRMKSK
jgi:hypothetical protein